MKIARIATETAELPSYEGVIDGCARVHWRRPAIFPLAGGGERQFISAQIAERRSIRVSPTFLLFGGAPSAGGLFRRARPWREVPVNGHIRTRGLRGLGGCCMDSRMGR